MRTDELLDLQIETLFESDGDGLIRGVNPTGGAAPPRVFLGRSPHGNRCLVRSDLPSALRAELRAIAAREPTSADWTAPPVVASDLRRALEAHAPVALEWRGPAWRLPEFPTRDPDVELLGPEHADQLKRFFSDWIPDLSVGQPCLALVVNGDALSLCCSARNGPHAAEASLHTAEQARGRGHAKRVTRAWAHAVQIGGRTALYSTSWSNEASRRVAASLGGELYGEDFHLT